jgi:ribosome-associated protein
MKLCSLSETGGQAKLMIQNRAVKVNGEIETRRRRKLTVGDVVQVGGKKFRVTESLSADGF